MSDRARYVVERFPDLTLPRQTGPGGKLTNHLEDGYDDEDTEAVHG